MTLEGWHGWDDYAAFYDWENARTIGRRDLEFWRRLVGVERPPVLELGCGTGRVLMPIARTGCSTVGIDRSGPMLRIARARARRLPRARRPPIAQADMRALPFGGAAFGVIVAAYGIVQSILNDSDLDAVLTESARVLKPRGLMAFDLVPDLRHWEPYSNRVQFRGRSRRGGHITLTESVRQDRRRGRTTFHEEFVERRGRVEERRTFSLTFRTVTVEKLTGRLTAAGFGVESTFGDYRGGPWREDAGAWIVLARKARR